MSAERRAARPPVLAEVSEWAAQELALALSITTTAAENLLTRSLTLVHRLPRSLAAVEVGLLHAGHLWPLLDKLAAVTDDRVRDRLEKDLLAWVARRDVTTPAQLRAKLVRELLARNVRSTARDLAAELRRRGVRLERDRVDGMAVLAVLLTVPEAQAVLDALGRYADALEDAEGEQPSRTRQQKMADCLLDLVLRPGETDLPVVQAHLSVVAAVPTLVGGDQPGEVGGEPVPAELVRALATGLGLLPEAEGATAASPDDRAAVVPAPAAEVEPDVDPADGSMAAADERWWAEVQARALRGEWGGEEDPPPEELLRHWAAEAEWIKDRGDGDVDDAVPSSPAPAPAVGAVATEPSWWAAADRAVDEATATKLDLHRALARARRAVDAAETADRADRDESPAARMSAAPDALSALVDATGEQRAALADLLQRTAGGGLADRPRIAVTDALTGALLALTDARDLRAAAVARRGLGPPRPTEGYRPGAALDRFLRARDRRCRQPGCRHRVPRGGELDHNAPWPHGRTAADNLTGFCTSHHRGKHQAPRWRYDLSRDGTLTVRTPTGLTASTDPPPY